jgi:CheY-like chemotaxis protein
MDVESVGSLGDALRLVDRGARYDAAVVATTGDSDAPALGAEIERRGPVPGSRLPVVFVGPAASAGWTAREAHVVSRPLKPKQLSDALRSALAATQTAAAPPVEPERDAVEATNLGPSRPGSLSVLLAEDNLVNQRVAVRLLAKLGCEADVVSNGVEAVEAAARRAYDLILMDIQMPEMDGYEATARIRDAERGARVRIVALTASTMTGDRERCLESGMDDYLSKPFRVEEMAAVVARAAECGREAIVPV